MPTYRIPTRTHVRLGLCTMIVGTAAVLVGIIEIIANKPTTGHGFWHAYLAWIMPAGVILTMCGGALCSRHDRWRRSGNSHD